MPYMKKHTLRMIGITIAAFLSALSPAASGQVEMCPRSRRATWVYTGRGHPDVIHNAGARDDLLRFAADHGIGEFFLRTQMDCAETPDGPSCQVREPDLVRAFLAATHGQQIVVHALRDGAGDANPPDTPIWASAELALDENHPWVFALLQAVLDFNAGGGEAFDGIHLDIEPYTLSAYRAADDAGKIAIIFQFLNLNRAIVQMLGTDFYSMDIGPGWHGFEPSPNLWMEFDGQFNYPTMHLLNMVKTAALLVYLNDPARIINKDRPVVEYANQPTVNASVYLGVQTCPGREGTFGAGTQTQMEQALCQVNDAFAAFDSFRGFSYFSYTCHSRMPE